MLHIFVREIVKNIIMNETEKGMSKDQEKELIRLCAHLDELVERLGKAEGRLKEFNNRMLGAEPIPISKKDGRNVYWATLRVKFMN